MVSSRPLISNSSSPYTNLLVTVTGSPITNSITVIFMFIVFFSSLSRSRYLFLFSLSFSCSQWSVATAKSTVRQVFFSLFFLNFSFRWLMLCLVAWPKLDDLYLKIQPNFVHFIFQDGFWVELIQFVRMVKFKFLAKFSVDYHPYPAVSSLKTLFRLI